MPKESMTPRERWLAVLNHQTPDRVPTDYWATAEATSKLMEYLGCATEDEMFRCLHIDRPVRVAPRYVGPPVSDGLDEWGTGYYDMDYGIGVYHEPASFPLAQYETVDEIEENYTWPSPDWYDCTDLADQLKGREEYPVLGGGLPDALQMYYWKLRGIQLGIMDMAANPEMVHYCLDKLFDFHYQNTLRIFEQLPDQVTLCYVTEDLGTQEGLMFSPKHIHEFVISRMRPIIELVHQAGAFVFFHSDGSVRRILPDLIDAGIDLLNPIQWRCSGMDREGLKRDFGARLVLHGAMDNQQTLAFGSVADVRQEVMDNLRILGDGGGYILAPCHNIQAVSPPENIVAMYQTCNEHGWY